MNGAAFPGGFRLEPLTRAHPRRRFSSGEAAVDGWLRTRALEHQEKHLSTTKVLLDPAGEIAGYYTLATAQVDFGHLPLEMARRLPRRALPAAVLAWLGVGAVGSARRGQGLGTMLLARALRDCHEAGRSFAFVAVIIDCIGDAARAFYGRWDFAALPGHPYRLFLSAAQIEAMMRVEP